MTVCFEDSSRLWKAMLMSWKNLHLIHREVSVLQFSMASNAACTDTPEIV